jgi:hypothetical protein
MMQGCARLPPAAILWLVLVSLANSAAAQQFVTDDAGVVDFRACQLEAWHGQSASWLLPACQPFRRMEVTAGLGFVAQGNQGRSSEYVFQTKVPLQEWRAGGLELAAVAGVGRGPLAQVTGRLVEDVYAYVPATLGLLTDRLDVHSNFGWRFDREPGELPEEPRRHALTWAFRGDLRTNWRVILIGEIFGESRTRSEFQAGIRAVVIPGRLLIDVSRGASLQRGQAGAGWAIGLAWTPGPLL